MTEFALILVSTILVNNFVLSKFLGLCPFMGVSRKLETATDGYYTVDTADESREVRHANYQGNFPRLLELKKKYDPTNLFRLNANIRPSAAG